ncbi:methyltransferase-like protein 24 [Biomphalaria pfeifferi]|uniref:Methyltransferase-like protein 24 n=1 Tax=Biomphalaria pfeifferi TaxID=112525 RepID=A0AAD8EZ39_BIOPF|nr:methyltransferase-like protein 24 [Biomphalaria pfeifferi]
MVPRNANAVSMLCLIGIIVLVVLHLRPQEVVHSNKPLYRSDESDLKGSVDVKTHNEHVTIDEQVTKDDTGTGPLSIVRAKGYVNNLASLDLDTLSDEELLLSLHSHVDNANVLCDRKLRMGKVSDGGWEVCDDPDVRPREPCIIYSFGINNDFSFDDDAAAMYGCHVYSFDPSMTRANDQYDRSPKVHFYKIGLDGRTYVNIKKWPLFTFQDIRKKLGHQNTTADVIKMDIESSEWAALPEMVVSGQLSGVKQMLVEYHLQLQTRNYVLPKLRLMQNLEVAGFKRFYVHKNPVCKLKVKGMPMERTKCYEVHYLKR